MIIRLRPWSLAIGLALGVAACDPGDVSALRERAHQAWSEVQTQYSQRADQVPPLVEAVRKKAPGERAAIAASTKGSSFQRNGCSNMLILLSHRLEGLFPAFNTFDRDGLL